MIENAEKAIDREKAVKARKNAYMKKYRIKKNPKAWYEAQLRYIQKKLAELQQEE